MRVEKDFEHQEYLKAKLAYDDVETKMAEQNLNYQKLRENCEQMRTEINELSTLNADQKVQIKNKDAQNKYFQEQSNYFQGGQ